ncbi:hypothetical protein [uncultured Chryseobacterium sp.]|nr:hypothetical protein [uncultured Chryseobacterium sp.]
MIPIYLSNIFLDFMEFRMSVFFRAEGLSIPGIMETLLAKAIDAIATD